MMKTHSLKWPLTGQQPLSTLDVSPIDVMSYEALRKNHNDDDERERDLISQSTGVAIDVLVTLKTPDYNSVRQLVRDFVDKPSNHFIPKMDKDEPTLLVPIKGDDGKDIKNYTLECPTVDVSDKMKNFKEDSEKSVFLASACTTLSHSEVEKLSMPDWNFLLDRLNDFLSESADFFR
ncbi:phage tail assembly protein [Alteromonadaceae bacterium M269]|nr:phage tail assembly protein [Alteromonadaceae bacterium M269]